MSKDKLQMMLEMQLGLQATHMKDGDPRALVGDELADFVRWNVLALEDELHEALGEIGWKPWASSRHVNREQFIGEMVDAFHFFMNLLLAVSRDRTPEEIAEEFFERYALKNKKNAQRQEEGYDGIVGKCPWCKRELSEVEQLSRIVSTDTNIEYCSLEHKVMAESGRSIGG